MGPGNPWSPNWRPDPTGRRAMAIRASRRGALLAAVLLWPIALAATLTSPGTDDSMLARAALLALLSWPGLALLGAGLAPTAVGSRIDAIAAGVALAVGAPIASIASTAIGIAILVLVRDSTRVDDAIGLTIRLGVLGALRYAPLVAVAVVLWTILLRRHGRAAGSGEPPPGVPD
ncbi:MAG TPA: hypothetical protein VFI69_06780 [Candidatus Limnocylindrales bacterium]|jgi:hypothetical protein|nr:hypothetical protein [Candidatus Limnocylindrales bacterium]